MRFDVRSLIEESLLPLVDDLIAFNAKRIPGVGPRSLAELEKARAQRDKREKFVDASAATIDAAALGWGVPVRIFTPADGNVTGVHLTMHGGGFYLGSAADDDPTNVELANQANVAVVSVDYRLAPEWPWPAAPDDCETAALWLIDEAQNRFGTTTLTIGGFSAGATLAMTTLLRLRERGLADRFAGAALQFGTYDLSATTPAGRLIADEYFLAAYVGRVDDRTIPDVSPIFADLTGLPPTLIVVGESDVLLDDNLAFAARLSAAGNAVDLRVYPQAPHGFTSHPTEMAAAARDGIADWITRLVRASEQFWPGVMSR